MEEKIKQKGFIPILILVGAFLLVSASVATTIGVVKYKDEIKSAVANISATVLKSNKSTKDIKESILPESTTTDSIINDTEKEEQRLTKDSAERIEKLRIEDEKANAEVERLRKEREEVEIQKRLEKQQELQRQLEIQQSVGEEQQKQEVLQKQEEARILAEEETKQEQNKQVLSEYLKRTVEAKEQFYKQLLQEIQKQIAEKEVLVKQLDDLYTQINQIDQQMTNTEQKIDMLPYTIREEVKIRIQDFSVTQSQFERIVAAEIQEQEALLRQKWWNLSSQRQPLADRYNLLRGNTILNYQPQYPPQLSSVGDYVFQYSSAGKVSYIINPDYTESYVYYTGDNKVDYILNSDGSKMNFHYLGNGQLDRISGF